MSSEARDLQVEVVVATDGDAEELELLTLALGDELRELRTGTVLRPSAPMPPPGSRAGVPIDPGTLVVALEHGVTVLPALVHALQSWLDRRRALSSRPGPTIEIRLGRDLARLTPGELSADQQRLLAAFLAAHPEH